MTSGSWRRKARSADGKCETHLVVHVDLVDAGQIDFRRILRRRDVAILGIENIEARVQRHGLAAARRAGHQNHALRFGEILQVCFALRRLVSQGVDAEHGARGVENTRDHLLAEQGRAGAHAKVDGAILGEPHFDAAVLRHAPLGDIEPRHDLEAGDDLDRQLHRRQGDLFQHAVDARADAKHFLVGLEMDVRAALFDGIEQDFIDEADDRRVLDIVAAERFRIRVLVAAA